VAAAQPLTQGAAMQSRWIINLVLVVVIGALALVALYEPGIDQAPQAQAITGLDPEQIDTVRIHRPPRDDLVLARHNQGGWVIESHAALPADRFQVAALTRLAGQKAVRSYAVAELDLVRLALEPPRASITLDNTRVDFGDTEPLEGLRYVRVSDQVHLTPDIYQHLIDAGFSQFVRRRLLPERVSIRSLRLPAFSVNRSNHDWMVEPQQNESAGQVQQLIDNWQQASALSVTSADASTAGERIEVVLDDAAQPLLFVIATREPDLVLLRPDQGLEYRMGDLGDALLALPQPATEQAQ
jgi:hypothetical protein